jgi:hypothetical protein
MLLLAGLLWVLAAPPDPCASFSWDVSRELEGMRSAPQAIGAARRPDALPRLELEKLYSLSLAPQSEVRFAHPPGKPMLADGAHAGLVVFGVAAAGRYRISSSGPHWLDVVDNERLIASRDFQGRPGCARPHKIVEYELPAGRNLVLQLSGGVGKAVDVLITRSPS